MSEEPRDKVVKTIERDPPVVFNFEMGSLAANEKLIEFDNVGFNYGKEKIIL